MQAKITAIGAGLFCVSAALITAGQTTSAPATRSASRPARTATKAANTTSGPAETEHVKLITWKVNWQGITVTLEHPAEWKHTRTADDVPFLTLTGAAGDEKLAVFDFGVVKGLKGRAIKEFMEDAARTREKAGITILEKSVSADGRQATLTYSGVHNGQQLTSRQTFLQLDDDHVFITSGETLSMQWDSFEGAMARITASASVTLSAAADDPGGVAVAGATPPASSPALPAATRPLASAKSEIRWPGVTVSLEYPHEWRQVKASNDHPFLYLPSAKGPYMDAGIDFSLISDMTGRKINELLADRIKGVEKDGAKVLEKNVSADGHKAEFLYAGTTNGIEMTGRQTILLVDEKRVLVTAEIAPSERWEEHQGVMNRIVSTAGLTVETGK